MDSSLSLLFWASISSYQSRRLALPLAVGLAVALAAHFAPPLGLAPPLLITIHYIRKPDRRHVSESWVSIVSSIHELAEPYESVFLDILKIWLPISGIFHISVDKSIKRL
jgi:hypothetical protein